MASTPLESASPPPLQQRRNKPAMTAADDRANGAARAAAAAAPPAADADSSARPPISPPPTASPYLPTAHEARLLAVFPVLLLFGTLYRQLAPETRHADVTTAPFPFAPATTTSDTLHFVHPPGYFARKDNLLNVLFVKRGWFWISLAFALVAATHPALARSARRQTAAVVRWALVTAWWIIVTQWCFGPPLIDRSFRLTGGGCEALVELADADTTRTGTTPAHLAAKATAAACRGAGGQWRGGHDISGHVFLLVLGSAFLAQEAGRLAAAGGWWPQRQAAAEENRTVVVSGGRITTADAEANAQAKATMDATGAPDTSTATLPAHARLALRFAAAVVALCLWMLLMTAIYFHTWSEKLTGLLVALAGFYGVYVVPRWAPALRRLVGLPGV
ncbi:Fat storage-inducing transmembrane protein [Niveomyces insectorum RCEF 264]|uniref:Acyl-coenzyme A diphosphatase SCS3 n=1 Tax=Niveomyces insectorum RCEF 264 TaxID=1081102 RepID=A0A167X069_9HYPO|nr:Fat storage-inducing transmembrane protein [Niveomyces insectorum RCEF 264]